MIPVRVVPFAVGVLIIYSRPQVFERAFSVSFALGGGHPKQRFAKTATTDL
jgi:hypothetical protein